MKPENKIDCLTCEYFDLRVMKAKDGFAVDGVCENMQAVENKYILNPKPCHYRKRKGALNA